MSKKDIQILELTAELARITNDRDAKTKRMWSLGKEADKLQEQVEELQREILRLVKDREDLRQSVATWTKLADAEKALRARYRDLLDKLVPLLSQMRQTIKSGNRYNDEVEKLSDEAEAVLRSI